MKHPLIQGEEERDMPRAVSAAMIVVAAACLAVSCTPRASSSNDKTALVALEQEFTNAYLTNDTRVFSRVLADDYIGLNPSGTREGKAQVLADVGSPDYKMNAAHVDVTDVRIFGDTAVVTVSGTAQFVFKGKDLSGKYIEMDVFVKRNGTWQQVASETAKVQ